jgi:hypothetical protein
MTLSETIHDKLIKKRNERGLFLFSNGIFLLLGVLSSVDFGDLTLLKITSWIAIGASLFLLIAGVCAIIYYHFCARKFSS